MGGREADDLCRVAGALAMNARPLLADHAAVQAQALQAVDTLRKHTVRDDLAQMPVTRLKDVTGGRLRTGARERSGITTVLQVHDMSAYRLQELPGVGAQTAKQIKAAADQIEEAARQLASVRIERHDRMSEALVTALKRLRRRDRAPVPRPRRPRRQHDVHAAAQGGPPGQVALADAHREPQRRRLEAT